MRHRRSKGRSKSRASFIDERRLGPGKVSPRHGGGAEAVSAGLTESALRAPRKRHAPVSSEVCDRGVGSSVVFVPGSELIRPQVRWQLASATMRVVKRAGLRSRWAATHRAHARRRVGDDEPERGRVRVLVTKCREAERTPTYLDLVLPAQGNLVRQCET